MAARKKELPLMVRMMLAHNKLAGWSYRAVSSELPMLARRCPHGYWADTEASRYWLPGQGFVNRIW